MKAKRGEIERAVDDRAKRYRLYLLHGPDTAGSRALAGRVGGALGPDAERMSLAAGTLKSDPALLADEAAALSLFGGARFILVEGGGDELAGAVAALLDAPAAGNPVAIVAGVLRSSSKLLQLAEASPLAIAAASYVPEGRDADRMVAELGRAVGLDIAPGVARRIAEASAGDRAIVARELEKFALFLDAEPSGSASLDDEAFDALSAGSADTDLSRVVDAVFEGDLGGLDRELIKLGGGGTEAVTTLRALARRAQLLARLRSDVELGTPVASVMASKAKSVFYKEKAAVERQLGRWSSSRLAAVSDRILAAERAVKSPGSLGGDGAEASLFAIALSVATSRRR